MSNNVNIQNAGSNPAPATNFPQENAKFRVPDTVLTQETPEFAEETAKVRFPKRIKHRGKVLAVVYAKSKTYPLYRVAWSIHGKRRMKSFPHFGGKEGANQYAENLVKDLAKGSQVTALTPAQAADALAALERLQSFYQSTGKRYSLLGAVSEFADSAIKLIGHSLNEAVSGFLGTVATVSRKDFAGAVEDFISAQEPKSKSTTGQRPEISPKWAYNRALILRRIAKALPNTAVCELSKAHLDTVFSTKPLSEFSPKSRNHHRAALKQFLQWAVRKDFLSPAHRLGEAEALKPQKAAIQEIQIYTPKEFEKLLLNADTNMRPMIAIGGFAGLRTSELLQLSWEDVWRIHGHIEVTAGKAKTRQRRLVEMVPALESWLEPYRECKGKVWVGESDFTAKGNENLFHKRFLAVCNLAKVKRKENALRHSFCSFHLALNGNENLTAMQAGNSPQMLHANYKGLCTKAEAEKWFNVVPAKHGNIIPIQLVANNG